MAPITFLASQAHSINQYKNIRMKVMKCCASMYFNRQCLEKTTLLFRIAIYLRIDMTNILTVCIRLLFLKCS